MIQTSLLFTSIIALVSEASAYHGNDLSSYFIQASCNNKVCNLYNTTGIAEAVTCGNDCPTACRTNREFLNNCD